MDRHYIEEVEVTKDQIGSPVTYVPPHAKGNLQHKDCAEGTLQSWNHLYIFVLFSDTRTTQACNPRYLKWG